MKKISAALICGLLTASALSTAVEPAWALGGCGPNRHRGPGGHCVAGGQNQGWCKRHTGHAAVADGHGRMVCR